MARARSRRDASVHVCEGEGETAAQDGEGEIAARDGSGAGLRPFFLRQSRVAALRGRGET